MLEIDFNITLLMQVNVDVITAFTKIYPAA